MDYIIDNFNLEMGWTYGFHKNSQIKIGFQPQR